VIGQPDAVSHSAGKDADPCRSLQIPLSISNGRYEVGSSSHLQCSLFLGEVSYENGD